MTRTKVFGLLCLIGLLWLLLPTPRLTTASQANDFRPGAVLVKIRPGASPNVLIERGLLVERTLTSLSISSVQVPIGQEQIAVEALRRDPAVVFAELDYSAHTTDIITPTDPGWSQQWDMRQIEAPAAWAALTDTTIITVAVVDSGLALNHEDLAARRWINPGEIAGNGLDDDGNGKVDDVNGWHFFQKWTGTSYVPAENADVQDDYGHGTHVAGIAAAVLNNDIGIAGVAPQARVMPVKVLDQYGSGWYSDIAAGMVYAADNGARIINLSLGGAEDSQTLRAAVDYACSHGALVVAATGNTGGAVLYPAAYEPVLAVAATDQNDQVAYFSNRGPQVDVAAPGVDIYSTWPWVTGYFTKSGTSMATPHVSGVAALIWSGWPELSAAAVAHLIIETAVDVNVTGWDAETGWGRVDAYRAVQRAAFGRLFLPLISK